MQSIQKPLNLIIRIVKSKRLLATYQARREHSAPILKKLGFTEYETYLQFAKNLNL